MFPQRAANYFRSRFSVMNDEAIAVISPLWISQAESTHLTEV